MNKTPFVFAAIAAVVFGSGVMVGIQWAEAPAEDLEQELAMTRARLSETVARLDELQRQGAYQATAKPIEAGRLSYEARRRHRARGAQYVAALKSQDAQSAADQVEWFVSRWEELLDHPQRDDRTTRRAEALVQVVSAMAMNLNPGDYIPWQMELMTGNWLAELHFDLDGDGIPGARTQPVVADSFTGASVCQVAMALNQLTTDARILLMPGFRCQSERATLNLLLAGKTRNQALNEFVRAAKASGIAVIDKSSQNVRWILLGLPSPPSQQ